MRRATDSYTYHVARLVKFGRRPLDRPDAGTSIQKAIKRSAAKAQSRRRATSRASCSTPLVCHGAVGGRRRQGHHQPTRRGTYVERSCHLLEAADAPVSDDALEFSPFGLLEQQSDGEPSSDRPSCVRSTDDSARMSFQAELA